MRKENYAAGGQVSHIPYTKVFSATIGIPTFHSGSLLIIFVNPRSNFSLKLRFGNELEKRVLDLFAVLEAEYARADKSRCFLLDLLAY